MRSQEGKSGTAVVERNRELASIPQGLGHDPVLPKPTVACIMQDTTRANMPETPIHCWFSLSSANLPKSSLVALEILSLQCDSFN